MSFTDPAIAATFDRTPEPARTGLLRLRDLIFDVAQGLPDIGRVEEVLRWGQPSYITPDKKAATPLRLGTHKSASFAIFAHCQSNVIANYATRFPGWDRLDGNRAVLFDRPDQIEPFRLRSLIEDALTYHLR
ncbi:MAG: DUF1801 domain-containing protein [Cognatishimia sp.]|uniref:DUF1801 domain-containing protein n=1 Tax=Cognatishimia sp. TaxID=2211648 RepID=UPI003B8B1358